MRLTPDDFEARVFARLDERLSATSPRPVALGLSGGGDSMALALIAAAWARRAGRRLLILNVDHRLQAASAAWADHCAALAARLGADFQALAWECDKPATGLPAAARTARHRLLADAARAAGARVILLGHTADDVLEAAAMRAAGSTTPDPRCWSPSPVWPQGRGLHIARPLLDVRRAALRQYLRELGEIWIEDPANDDLRYARPRARRALGETPPPASSPPSPPPPFSVDLAGVITVARRDVDPTFLGRAVVCAGGGARLPSRERLQDLADRLAGTDAVTASLAGASVVTAGDRVLILREPGEARRGGLAPITVAPGLTDVWDGRFEITAGAQPLEVGPLGKLPDAGRQALRGWPPRARRGLPQLGEGWLLKPPPEVMVRELVSDRLAAACGLIVREPD